MDQLKDRDMPAGRGRLIDAAFVCMSKYGQDGTTVRKIAEEAGFTPGLVKHHFGNKENLLVETYRHLNENTVGRIARALNENQSDIGKALDGALQALFPSDLSDVRQMRVLVAFWGLVLTNPNFAKVQADTNAQTRALFCQLAAKQIGNEDDAADIADGIIALTDGLWLECCMNPNRMPPAKAVQIAVKFSQASLGLGH